MIVRHELLLDCADLSPLACSDLVLTKLGHGPSFKLKAERPTDMVHGHVTITHHLLPLPHVIEVTVYEVDDLPRIEPGQRQKRETILKRPTIFLTPTELKTRLDEPAREEVKGGL